MIHLLIINFSAGRQFWRNTNLNFRGSGRENDGWLRIRRPLAGLQIRVTQSLRIGMEGSRKDPYPRREGAGEDLSPGTEGTAKGYPSRGPDPVPR